MRRSRWRASVLAVGFLAAGGGALWPGAGAVAAPPSVGGPWPPSAVLAPGSDRLTAPDAAVSPGSCPTAPYGVRSSAPGTTKTVALTFDDGPGATTAALLSILQRSGVPATFFNLGVNQAVRPALVRSEATLDLVLGNHTWDHPRLPTLSTTAQASQLDRASRGQAALTGITPCVFRPPYGEYNATTLTLAQQRRMTVWNWSVDTEDWKAGTSTSQDWVNRIVSRAQAGGSQQHPVILMHNPPAGIPATVSALPAIISYYRSRGYTFVDLLGSTGSGWPRPAAAATAAGVHLAVRNSNGGVSLRTADGGSWTNWTGLGGQVIGGPAATVAGTDAVAVHAIGTDNGVWTTTVPDGGPVAGWTDLGGTATSTPAVARAPNGVTSVVVRGSDGAAWLRQHTGSGWGAWTSLGGVLVSAPAVAVTGDGRLTVAMIGSDQALYVRQQSDGWSPWRRVGGYVTGDAALSTTPGGANLVAVVRGGDGAGWVNVSDVAATNWRGWEPIGGSLASSLAVTASGSTLQAFGYGTDGRIWRTVAADGANAAHWSGWQLLPS